MKIKSWPLPPIKNNYNYNIPPTIPSEFRIFGINYLYKDHKILPKDIESSIFDKEKVINLIKESYSKYLKLLEDNCTEEINEIHLKLNEELNKCKDLEVGFEIKRLKNEKNRRINGMIEELEGRMV
ncbi:hypothetical protein NBO_929g0005 [Nosema bombycis CQ1]|uniref:Uncharacterized protein n=1 Tax=Nosema bombycis (strain CQ1 / CVCC 102059) TaxID=578461 RepID=R0KNG8_NOSB1|nr:hypothetical protein NBO_929g0005 [Nosema bombycis CQ1]|eukprot:EOB11707.1 hypothetical protein NBO_929g0005 [Nosema bombycis CQ1]